MIRTMIRRLTESCRMLERDLRSLKEGADEATYQRLVSDTLAFTAGVARLGEAVEEEKPFTVIRGGGKPVFETRGRSVVITFPSILKKSRRLTKPADLEYLYEKYERPAADYFWDRETAYGEKRVFWFEFHGWKGDCDNLETKVIVDLLAGYFVPDDTGEYLSVYQSAVPDSEVKTVLRILTREDFVKELKDASDI